MRSWGNITEQITNLKLQLLVCTCWADLFLVGENEQRSAVINVASANAHSPILTPKISLQKQSLNRGRLILKYIRGAVFQLTVCSVINTNNKVTFGWKKCEPDNYRRDATKTSNVEVRYYPTKHCYYKTALSLLFVRERCFLPLNLKHFIMPVSRR